MEERILKYFEKKNNRILYLKNKSHSNNLYDWPKMRFPLRVIGNYIVNKFCSSLPLGIKSFLYRHVLNMKIGKNVAIAPEAQVDAFYPELIEVEDNVIIGMNVTIFAHEFTHEYFRFGKVTIGKNALIGAGSTIRSGVRIGAKATVAMCSFVNKDVPPGEVWGGVPAKRIRKK
ncbi:MAG: acyltransferase [archaeon]